MTAQQPVRVQQAANPETCVNCDQEAWVVARLETLVRLAQAIANQKRVGADESALTSALDGAVHGTAIEVLQTVGLRPCHTNIRKPARIDLLVPKSDAPQLMVLLGQPSEAP